MDSHSALSKHDHLKPLKIAAIIAVTFWALNFVAGLILLCTGDAGARLGDSFGVVNALFSSVAVAGAIYAVILQQRQFSIAETRERELVELQAVSAYSQCLAACAQFALTKTDELNKRLTMSEITDAPPDLKGAPPERVIQLLEIYGQTLDNQRKATEVHLKNVESYHEMANGHFLDLNVALHVLKGFPSVVSRFPHPRESEPAEPSAS